MLRIAICDDEEKQLRETAALVNSYLHPVPTYTGIQNCSGAAVNC